MDVMLLALAFAVISSSFVYKITDGLVGKYASFQDAAGRPTIGGTVAHTLVFAVVAAFILSRV